MSSPFSRETNRQITVENKKRKIPEFRGDRFGFFFFLLKSSQLLLRFRFTKFELKKQESKIRGIREKCNPTAGTDLEDAIRRSLSSIKLYYLYWQLTRLSSWLVLLTQISLSLSLSASVHFRVASLHFSFSFFSPQKIIKLRYHAIVERDYDFAPGGGLHYIFAIVLVSFWKMETLSYFHYSYGFEL